MNNQEESENSRQEEEYNYKNELERIIHKRGKPFPLLDEEWFDKYGIVDPSVSSKRFKAWFNKEKNRHLDPKNPVDHIDYLKVLWECGTGLRKSTCDAYVRGQEYWRERPGGKGKIGRRKLICLNTMTSTLRYPIPPWSLPKRKIPKNKIIAILAELTGIPSEGYHFELIRRITQAATEHKYEVSLHPVHQSNIQEDIIKFMYTFDPYVVVLIRLSPKDLSRLEDVPTILVHADRKSYPYPPVICNIVPDQSTIKDSLKKWANQVLTSEKPKNTEIVVVSVEEEHIRGSIRDERIHLMVKALKSISSKVKVSHCIVPDYSFRHSIKIFQKYKNSARLFICLSDPLAVCIKHLLIATGANYKHRVCGFDFSMIAQAENVTSFDQGLSEIAPLIYRKLQEYQSGRRDFEEINIRVNLRTENPRKYPELNDIKII